jgi:hypothetical protein
MDKVVVYENQDGGIALLYPAPNCGLTLQQIIAKDVPSGAKYKILQRSDIPTDRTYRDAWVMDFSDAEVNT